MDVTHHKKIISLSLLLVLLISIVSSCASADTINEPSEPVDPVVQTESPDLIVQSEPLSPFVYEIVFRDDTPFDLLPFYLPETDELREAYSSFVTAMDEAESAQEQLVLIMDFDRNIRAYTDMSSISYIRFAQNISDETQADWEHFIHIFAETTHDENEAYAAIINSKYEAQLEEYFGTAAMERLRKSVREYSPEQAELNRQILELENRYTRLYDEKLMNIPHEGEAYSYFELQTLLDSEEDASKRASIRDKLRLRGQSFIKESDIIFTRLRSLRTQEAVLVGYDSYTEYALSKTSLSLRDVKAYIDNVKNTLLPVYQSLVTDAENRNEDLFPYADSIVPLYGQEQSAEANDELAYKLTVKLLISIISEMEPMTDYLERNGFIDVMPRANKDSGGFTSTLDGIQVPFIFSHEPDPDILIHEFAHAFEAYEMPVIDFMERFNTTPEIWEVSATSLQALATSRYDLLYGDMAVYAVTRQMLDMFSIILYGAMYSEFEIALYESPDMAARQRDELFDDLSEEYCLPKGAWQTVPHFFDAPAYYINYSLSSVVALELWRIKDNDYSEAKEMFLRYVRDSTQTDFSARLENAGLANPFDLQLLEGLAVYLESVFSSE